MTPVEKEHITRSLQFELSKVETRDIRLRMLGHLEQINEVLAAQVARALGERPRMGGTAKPGGTADSAAEMAVLAAATTPTSASGRLHRAKGLSQEEGQPRLARGRKVAILAAEGVNAAQVAAVSKALTDAGAMADIVGPHLGALAEGVVANKTLANTDPVLYDAVLVPGGAASIQTLIGLGDAHNFVAQAYKHAKPIGALGEGTELLTASEIGRLLRAIAGAAQAPAGRPDAVQNLSEVGGMRLASGAGAQQLAEYGIVVGQNGGTPAAFVSALGHHRYWGRPNVGQVPA